MEKTIRNRWLDKIGVWELGVILVTLISVFLYTSTQHIWLLFFPVVLLIGVICVSDLRILFFAFAAVLPFSVEVELPGGLSTDLPSEPIMWAITGISIIFIALKHQALDFKVLKHPISVLILTHLIWIGVTSITSTHPVISMKYFLAKSWYVIPFFYLTSVILANEKGRFFSTFMTILLSSMLIAVIIVMIRHSMQGFSFKSINKCVHPIFRNHVNYAVMLVGLLPFVFWKLSISRNKSFWGIALLIFISATYFSYTRAAILAVFIGVVSLLIIHFRWIKISLITTMIGVMTIVPYYLHENQYLDLAPNFERTIAHYEFDNLLSATTKGEDISTMERLYRWVAGIEMVKDKPVLGFGPGTFYSEYNQYTLTAFQTYVSHNPERSGIHNYFLMVLVEQGILGMLIWIIIVATTFIIGENLYHRMKIREDKSLVLASLVSLIMVTAILIINDLIEVDKVGPLYFMCICIIAVYSYKKIASENDPPEAI